jgi:uncharacterized protein YlxP (DUF503 family)
MQVLPEMKVGLVLTTLYLRHSQSLKDKRRVLQSLIEKLRNSGFSVSEIAFQDNTKRASLGFAFVSSETGFVSEKLQKARRLFIGDYDVTVWEEKIENYEAPLLEETEEFLSEEEV